MMYRISRTLLLTSLSLALWIVPSHLAVAQGKRPSSPSAASEQESAYERAMRIGYAATDQGDYQTALINFRRALAARPNDPYATAAIRNVEFYIQRRRQAVINQRIASLEATLDEAATAQDWTCALATVDQLIQLVPPESFGRARLIVYRSEILGLIENRTNLEQWATVCSPIATASGG